VFEVYRKNQIGPNADRLGAALSGYSPVLEAVDPGNTQIKIGGLPSGYVLSRGDLLSFSYDGGARRSLHRVVVGRTHNQASAFSGHTSLNYLTVTPHVRPGYLLGASVELIRPYCLAMLVPGSVSKGITRNGKTAGMEFQFRQTLRGY
jgi:hypothetical protein